MDLYYFLENFLYSLALLILIGIIERADIIFFLYKNFQGALQSQPSKNLYAVLSRNSHHRDYRYLFSDISNDKYKGFFRKINDPAPKNMDILLVPLTQLRLLESVEGARMSIKETIRYKDKSFADTLVMNLFSFTLT